MPIYEYQCAECGERTQRLQEFGEDSTGKKCLSCGKGAIKKVFSVFGISGSSNGSIQRSCSPQGSSYFT